MIAGARHRKNTPRRVVQASIAARSAGNVLKVIAATNLWLRLGPDALAPSSRLIALNSRAFCGRIVQTRTKRRHGNIQRFRTVGRERDPSARTLGETGGQRGDVLVEL